MGPPDSTYSVNIKRRRTDWANNLSQSFNFDATQESSFDIFATTETTFSASADGPSAQLPAELQNTTFSIHHQIAPASTSEQSTTMKLLHVEIPGPSYDISSTHKSFNRSKSMPPEPDSPNDTEPMSSITFARARRAISDFVDPQQSQYPSTFDASPGDPVIPEPMGINALGMESFHSGGPVNEHDELDSEVFGGMPKEMYKPRPSRSRGMKEKSSELAEAESEIQVVERTDNQYQTSSEQNEQHSGELGDIPAERYKPRPSRSRSKVHESIEPAEAEPEPVNTSAHSPEHTSNDQDALASEDFGGMPKEMYKPRPSRSRRRAQESVGLEAMEVQLETKRKRRRRSPSCDEMNFEVLGDIPQEQYKPRPSRSRSKPSDLVYIDQGTHRGHDPGLAVVIPQEVPIERVQHVDESQHKIKSEPVDEEPRQSQLLFEDRHEEPVDDPDPIDTIDTITPRKTETPTPEPAVLPQKKDRKKKGTVDSEATSRANSTVREKPAPKKRSRRRKAAESPVPEPVTVPVPDMEDPFNETSAPAAAEQQSNANPQPHHEKTTPNSSETEPQPTSEEPSNPQPQPRPSPQKAEVPPLSSPEKQNQPQTPPKFEKGPDKHSPISIRNKVPFRVGLSRRARIAPLLKVVRK